MGELWGRRSRLALGVGWTVGLVAVAGAWWGTSGEATVGRQFRWLSVGVAGVVLCLTAGATWVFAGMRAVGLRIRVAVPMPPEQVSAEPVSPEEMPAVVELRVVPEAASGALVAAPGMRYFHRPSCALAQGKAVRPADRSEHLRAGRAACGVCRPEMATGVSAA